MTKVREGSIVDGQGRFRRCMLRTDVAWHADSINVIGVTMHNTHHVEPNRYPDDYPHQ
jgi:hypothetical protein